MDDRARRTRREHYTSWRISVTRVDQSSTLRETSGSSNRQRAEMPERIDDAEAAIALGDISAGVANGAFHGFDGIRRDRRSNCANRPSSIGKIVVMIAGGENLVAFDPDEAREFAERRALAVSLVAKAQVDGVAHEIESRHPRRVRLEENRRPRPSAHPSP